MIDSLKKAIMKYQQKGCYKEYKKKYNSERYLKIRKKQLIEKYPDIEEQINNCINLKELKDLVSEQDNEEN